MTSSQYRRPLGSLFWFFNWFSIIFIVRPEKFSFNFRAVLWSIKDFSFKSSRRLDRLLIFVSFRLTFCCNVFIFFLWSLITFFKSSFDGDTYINFLWHHGIIILGWGSGVSSTCCRFLFNGLRSVFTFCKWPGISKTDGTDVFKSSKTDNQKLKNVYHILECSYTSRRPAFSSLTIFLVNLYYFAETNVI